MYSSRVSAVKGDQTGVIVETPQSLTNYKWVIRWESGIIFAVTTTWHDACDIHNISASGIVDLIKMYMYPQDD